jgi:MYXO-CTERM domain-containing protein
MRAWFWVGLLFGAPASAYATIPDPNFVETPLFGGLPTLTGLARAPDGSDRMFILQKEGIVRVVEAGGLLPAPFATISPIFLNSECGLIGMAFDPDFVNNHYVYFFVTVSATEQQIQRYTDVNNVGQSPTVILGGLPTRGRNHDGGGLGFGPDGKIYWSIGDNGNLTGGNADLTTLASKIGRANRDGTVPTDNPFYDGAGPNNDYIWARGFRNPFTMTFHPANGKLISSVVGSLYEQVFVVSAGDHAGWNTYENNQVAGYITPIIAYRTNGVDVRAITAIARSNGVLSVTTGAGANRFRRGMRVTLAGIGDPSMNGEVLVGDTPTPNVFQAIQPGPDASSSGGTAINQGFGGAITGGTFYDSTGFDAVHRGAFFFGDFNSGQLMRVPFDAQFRVERIDVFGTNLGATVDAEVAPDGNLWIGELGGRIFEIAQVQSAQGLIVTPLHLQVVEGGGAAITVRLAQDPGAPWVVTTSVQGDPDVGVVQGATLTFDSSNWRVPQPVVLAAAFDPDADADTATVSLSAAGLLPVSVGVRVRDQPQSLLLSGANLRGTEGSTVGFTVALSNPPETSVTVSVTSTHAELAILQGASLNFGPADFAVPQVVVVELVSDPDIFNGTASLQVVTSAAPPVRVTVQIQDDDPASPDAGLLDAAPDDQGIPDGTPADLGPEDLGITPDAASIDGGPADDASASDLGGSEPDAQAPLDSGPSGADDSGCACQGSERSSGSPIGLLLLLGLALPRLRPRKPNRTS